MNLKRPSPSKLPLACAGLVLCVFFWSLNTVLARGMVFTIKPMALSFFRWMSALVFILPFAMPALLRERAQIKNNAGFLVVLAVFSVAMYNSILYLGAQHTTATNISLVIAVMPGITILMAWGINRERPRPLQMTGALISLAGMLVIVSKGSLTVLFGRTMNPGDILIILSISSWAFYSVLLKKRKIQMTPLSFLTTLIAIGVVLIFPFYLLEFFTYGGFDITLQHAGVFVFLGICPSIISYICWNFGVRTAGAPTASMFMYLIPVFSSLLAVIFLGEQLYVHHFCGAFFILVGLFLSSRDTGRNIP